MTDEVRAMAGRSMATGAAGDRNAGERGAGGRKARGAGLLGRRAWLAAPLLLAARPAAALLPPAGYRFRVMREGREIGTHLTRGEPGGVVRTTLALEVKLLSFTVFRYRHDYAERWEAGRLVGFASRLVKDGREQRLELLAGPDGLRGTGPGGMVALPPGAAPLSWWEPAHLARPLFDAGTGEPLAETPRRVPQEGLTSWRWAPREAVALYDAGGRWVGFSIRGDDGSAVRYEPA